MGVPTKEKKGGLFLSQQKTTKKKNLKMGAFLHRAIKKNKNPPTKLGSEYLAFHQQETV